MLDLKEHTMSVIWVSEAPPAVIDEVTGYTIYLADSAGSTVDRVTLGMSDDDSIKSQHWAKVFLFGTLCFDKCLNAAGSVAVGTNSFTASWPTEHPQQLAACSFATSLSLRQFESPVFIEGSGRNRTHGKPIALFCPLILESWTEPRGSRRVSSWLVSASLSGSGKKMSNACRWWNLRPICDRSLVRLI